MLIPVISVDIERVFNSTKQLVTPDKNRLSNSTIKYLELLRYWRTRSIITQNIYKLV
jgi:hypothetical protein